MEKAFNKQDIDLMKKAVPDEYAAWMTDDIVDYMFDLDSDYKITIKVTDKEKIAKKDLEETLMIIMFWTALLKRQRRDIFWKQRQH